MRPVPSLADVTLCVTSVCDLRILERWVGVKSTQCQPVRTPFFVRLVSSSIAGRAIVGISFKALIWYERGCRLSVSSIYERLS